MARAQARRHQRERITGIALALLGVAVLVVAIFALREPNGHVSSAAPPDTSGATPSAPPSNQPTRSSQSAPPSTASTAGSSGSAPSTQSPSDPVKSVPLVVYNDTAVQGLARDAARRFEQGGWTVTRFDNLPSGISDIISTCAYYDAADPSAKTAAEALQQQFPTIQRAKPKFQGLGAGPVVVVLTPGYSAT